MGNTVSIFNKNNVSTIQIDNNGYFQYDNNVFVEFLGNNGYLSFHDSTNFNNVKFFIGNNSTVNLEYSSYLIHNMHCYASGDNINIKIGKNFSCYGLNIRFYDKNSELIIGDDCMFSLGIYIWGTDGHAIFDLETRNIINANSKSIHIGNHVWIGYGSTILKGSNIPNNCVIGAKSLICSSFHRQNTILAGHPAKIIRKNIGWSRSRIDDYKPE